MVERSNLKSQISNIMMQIGFTEKEITDFLDYWLVKLQEKPYYFMTLIPEDVINQKEKLEFSVQPDTLLRVRFIFEGLDAPLSVKPKDTIPHKKRLGFVVTDWGGTIIGKSCTDITTL